MRLVDDDDREVATGEVGEVSAQRHALQRLLERGRNHRKESRNHWFRMGDMFHRNPDGTLAFVDHKKYMISPGRKHLSDRN